LDAAAVVCQVEVDSDDESRSQGSLVDKEESPGNDTGEYVVSDGKEDDDKNEDQEDDEGDLSVGIALSDAFRAHLGALRAKSKKKANKANNTTAPSSSRVTKALGEVLVATLKSFKKGRQQRPFLAALFSPKSIQALEVKITKREVKEELSIKITSDEWKEIKLHARYPGPFNPVKQVSSFCNRIPEAVLTRLIEYPHRVS
jgi:hypothetical protein